MKIYQIEDDNIHIFRSRQKTDTQSVLYRMLLRFTWNLICVFTIVSETSVFRKCVQNIFFPLSRHLGVLHVQICKDMAE